jgi:hypothetical protein
MGDALAHIEAAIAEATKARASVTRSSTRQVRSAAEMDQLKAVAFAWFQTHRPLIAASSADLSVIDGAYHGVLEATARLSARTTYADALRLAKAALVDVRKGVATALANPPAAIATTPESPPGFAALTADPSMQAILNKRWEEVQLCVGAGAYLAATVMMGGLLETLLLARINVTKNKAPIFTAKAAPRDKVTKQTLLLADWKLVNMVEVAYDVGWITRSAKDVGNVLREFRNYIHPHKEHTDGVKISAEDARMFWEVCKAISRQVLASV